MKNARTVKILKEVPGRIKPEVGACYEVMEVERRGRALFAVIGVGACYTPVWVLIGDEAEWVEG